jgi:type II secretory ATPase GspE/PulE/Tfp pilus assembly ATPase PilB-like protein
MLASSAVHAIARLLASGAAATDLAATLSLVVNQRLLRRLCPLCSVEAEYPRDELLEAQFALSEILTMRAREPVGCAACRWTGYSGRVAVFETLVVDESVRAAIVADGSEAAIEGAAVRAGMRTLRRAALDLVRSGDVSLAHALKATVGSAIQETCDPGRGPRDSVERANNRQPEAGALAHASFVAPRRVGKGG